MPRLTARDLLAVVAIAALAIVVATLALFGNLQWALVALAGLVGLGALISRLEFAFRRRDQQFQRREIRSLRDELKSRAKDQRNTAHAILEAVTESRRTGAASVERIPELAAGMAALRSELRGMRVAQQLLSQSVASTRTELLTAAEIIGATRADIADQKAAAAYQRRQLRSDVTTDMQALTQLMEQFAPAAPLPLLSGWALSPSGLLFLTDAIERRKAELVVECGSGSSTLWMAMAMRRNGSGKVIALEHQEDYAARTRAVLEAHEVSEWAEVRMSPLVDTQTPRGVSRWYDVDADTFPGPIDILLVDGPPATTGRHARYAALPRLAPVLANNCLVVLDDADRAEERDVIAFWAEEETGLTRVPSPGHGIEVMEFARTMN